MTKPSNALTAGLAARATRTVMIYNNRQERLASGLHRLTARGAETFLCIPHRLEVNLVGAFPTVLENSFRMILLPQPDRSRPLLWVGFAPSLRSGVVFLGVSCR